MSLPVISSGANFRWNLEFNFSIALVFLSFLLGGTVGAKIQ
jgi:hypothetical protein